MDDSASGRLLVNDRQPNGRGLQDENAEPTVFSNAMNWRLKSKSRYHHSKLRRGVVDAVVAPFSVRVDLTD